MANLSRIFLREGTDVGIFLPRHNATKPSIWREDLGSEPKYWMTTGGFPQQVGMEDIGETAITPGLWDLVLTPYGGGYAGGGHGRYVNLHLQVP